ncbi:probable xyloglucan endotransglucosylase/hydrolase protein 30 [Selaginella moellendorffii]|nr:probable xyloglucan endotransglucosylase/hydrolase protein 30 [Selaginella moellendorffii]|eukprot:XP_002976477.2 probable xyloglucan endotransglucosylase/hydrolase protein 30 [Selaginella moellendorffii]
MARIGSSNEEAFALLAILASVLALLFTPATGSRSKNPPNAVAIDQSLLVEFQEAVPFRDVYSILWGHSNANELEDGKSIQLVLDRHSGSGFKSKEAFQGGFFSASIKLPSNYTAGVVTAFYASNSDKFPDKHDEIDFEFLGVVPGMPYVLQTNVYGNGSVRTGREERIRLWFDPSLEFHRYSVLWNQHHIVFFVDDVPIRQMIKTKEAEDYPWKPMSVLATIWDGSNWATSGGKFPVDYNRAPFVASFTNLKLFRDSSVYSINDRISEAEFGKQGLRGTQKSRLAWVRRKFLSYTYCNDKMRYPKPLPEC